MRRTYLPMSVVFLTLVTATSTWGNGPEHLVSWGSQGSGDGQFEFCVGMAVAPTGAVYVADRDNHRVQKFDQDGHFVAKWGTEGTADGEFVLPHSVAVGPNGDVYVSDSHQVQKFDADGNFRLQVTLNGSGTPGSIAVDRSCNIYVTEQRTKRIHKFTCDGKFLTMWTGNFVWPEGLAIDRDGTILIADFDKIQRFTLDGTLVAKWGTEGTGVGQFFDATDVAVHPDGTVYVADRGNMRVQAFDTNGVFLFQWGSYGSDESQFRQPTSLAIDALGNIYVAEIYNYRVQKFAVRVPIEHTPWGDIKSLYR